MQSTEATS